MRSGSTRPTTSASMRMRRRPSLGVPVLVAIAVAAVVTATHGGRKIPAYSEATTWRGLVGEAHPQVTIGERRVVVLRTPSVAQRLLRAKFATEQQERAWTAQAYAAQQQVLVNLAAHGLGVRPDYSYARVLDGFSAVLDPRAQALLANDPEVVGVYPVRAAFPAVISSSKLSPAAAPPPVTLRGYDGRGVEIALLDTGVDLSQPYLGGRVQAGIDVVNGNDDAGARTDPQNPNRRERHGTELAGLLVGARGPQGIHGVAPGATVVPVRVAGWQPDATGHDEVYARSDQLIAGLDRAVDPNGDGDTHDAARMALIRARQPLPRRRRERSCCCSTAATCRQVRSGSRATSTFPSSRFRSVPRAQSSAAFVTACTSASRSGWRTSSRTGSPTVSPRSPRAASRSRAGSSPTSRRRASASRRPTPASRLTESRRSRP